MMFQPFGHLVLVERLDTQKKSSGIIMPDDHEGRFWKVKVLVCGSECSKELFPGYICMANPLPQIDRNAKAFEDDNWLLLHEKDLLGRWVEQ